MKKREIYMIAGVLLVFSIWSWQTDERLKNLETEITALKGENK